MAQQQNPVRGFLRSTGLDKGIPEIVVKFQFNPSQISDKQAVSYATLNAPGLLLPVRQYSQGGDRTISFTVRVDALFAGPADQQAGITLDNDGSIEPELNKYRAFVYPQTPNWQKARASFVPLFVGARTFTIPPTCRFGYGDRVIDCIVTEVNITELQFNAQLAPLRADIGVTLVELSPYGNQPTPPPAGG